MGTGRRLVIRVRRRVSATCFTGLRVGGTVVAAGFAVAAGKLTTATFWEE